MTETQLESVLDREVVIPSWKRERSTSELASFIIRHELALAETKSPELDDFDLAA